MVETVLSRLPRFVHPSSVFTRAPSLDSFILESWGLPEAENEISYTIKKIKGLWKVASAEARQQRRRLDRMHTSLGYKKLLPLIEKYKRKHQQGRGVRMRDIRMQPACQHCGYGGMSGMPSYLLTCPVCKQWLTQSRQEYPIWEGGCTGNAHSGSSGFISL